MRTLSSTALHGEESSTADGDFGGLVIDIDIAHEQIFSHYQIDGELLSGEAEIVAIFPDGFVEVDIARVHDVGAGDRIPSTPPPPSGGPDVNPLDLLLGGGPS